MTRIPAPTRRRDIAQAYLGAKISERNHGRLLKWAKRRRFNGNKSATVDALIEHGAASGFPKTQAPGASATDHSRRKLRH